MKLSNGPHTCGSTGEDVKGAVTMGLRGSTGEYVKGAVTMDPFKWALEKLGVGLP